MKRSLFKGITSKQNKVMMCIMVDKVTLFPVGDCVLFSEGCPLFPSTLALYRPTKHHPNPWPSKITWRILRPQSFKNIVIIIKYLLNISEYTVTLRCNSYLIWTYIHCIYKNNFFHWSIFMIYTESGLIAIEISKVRTNLLLYYLWSST